jgi:hypothetical protein
LTGARLPAQACRENTGGERALERLGSEPGREIRLDLVGLEDEPRAESANVAINDVRLVI